MPRLQRRARKPLLPSLASAPPSKSESPISPPVVLGLRSLPTQLVARTFSSSKIYFLSFACSNAWIGYDRNCSRWFGRCTTAEECFRQLLLASSSRYL